MQKRIAAVFFAGALMSFLCWSVMSYITKKAGDFLEPDSDETPSAVIDWAALYPFNDDDYQRQEEPPKESLFEFVKHRCEDYTTEKLLGYQHVIEAARTYEDLIGWNVVDISEYNGVVSLHDGYLMTFVRKSTTVPAAEAVSEFAGWCEDRGINFLYANLPVKVCKYEDADVSGKLDFANQNADEFLGLLEEEGIAYLDFRKMLHDEGMSHHGAFYVTDHHWKAETGLWAARRILEYLKDNYSWEVDPAVLDPERFEYVIYPDWFLGSQGKKVTLARTEPEDFTVIYPKYRTHLRFEVPAYGIDTSGDFSIIYNMKQVEVKDYYYKSPYAAYKYADQPITRTHNLLCKNGKKLLVIHDSFSNCVIPFLALGIEYTDEIDLRHFTGSLKTYITGNKPDLVVVLYNSWVPARAKETQPQDAMYDFR